VKSKSMNVLAGCRQKNAVAAKAMLGVFTIVLLLVSPLRGAANASHHYTDKQMDALAVRVGQTFWLYSPDGKLPAFVNAPNAAAAAFRPGDKESFVITELAGRAKKDPYYAVKFASGKVAYIRPDLFHEALNLTILSADPFADEKRRAEQRDAEEKNRVDWIKAQPWSLAVKEAAIKKQPTPGLTGAEVKRVFGAPQRITKLRGPIKVSEEHWFYADGSVLVMTNGLLTRMERPQTK
jgi:hypothetical protein